eukprot:6059529-Pleurochrysis_carterae.AAC.1
MRAKRFLGPKREGSKRAGSPSLACEVVRVAQLLRRCRHALLLEYTEHYSMGGRRPPTTMAEMVEEYDTK